MNIMQQANRNYYVFTNRIKNKNPKFITVAFSVLYYYTIYIVDAQTTSSSML